MKKGITFATAKLIRCRQNGQEHSVKIFKRKAIFFIVNWEKGFTFAAPK